MDQGEFLDWVVDTVASPLYCGDQVRFGNRPQWQISTATNQASCATP